jgi:hypothetical protein
MSDDYSIMIHYVNHKGGINNLQVAEIIKSGMGTIKVFASENKRAETYARRWIKKTGQRVADLQEKRDEYILNESVTPDDHPSWGELADAQAGAEDAWNETEEGKELKALLGEV